MIKQIYNPPNQIIKHKKTGYKHFIKNADFISFDDDKWDEEERQLNLFNKTI